MRKRQCWEFFPGKLQPASTLTMVGVSSTGMDRPPASWDPNLYQRRERDRELSPEALTPLGDRWHRGSPTHPTHEGRWVCGWVGDPPRASFYSGLPQRCSECCRCASPSASVRVCACGSLHGASVCPTCALLIPGIQRGVCQGVRAAQNLGNNDKLFQNVLEVNFNSS